MSDERLKELADWFTNQGSLDRHASSKELGGLLRELILRREECKRAREFAEYQMSPSPGRVAHVHNFYRIKAAYDLARKATEEMHG